MDGEVAQALVLGGPHEGEGDVARRSLHRTRWPMRGSPGRARHTEMTVGSTGLSPGIGTGTTQHASIPGTAAADLQLAHRAVRRRPRRRDLNHGPASSGSAST